MSHEFIAIARVAKLLKLSRPTARKRLATGEIPGLIKHHGITRVKRYPFEKWLLSQGS